MPTDILPKITTGHILSIQGILGIFRCTRMYVQCSTCIHTYHVGSHCLVRNDYGKVSLKSVNADKSFFAHAISDPKLGTE